MALPSLSDVAFIIVLLIPGYVALVLLRWIAILERKISDYVLVISSVFLSLLIYSIYGSVSGITDFDSIRDSMLLPANLLSVLGLSLIVGTGSGLIIRVAFRRGFVRGDSWEAAMKIASNKGSWVIVHTEDGHEYMGALHYSGGREFPKEVSIRNPTLIRRDSKGDFEEEIDFGKEILFREEDIRRIVFFEEV